MLWSLKCYVAISQEYDQTYLHFFSKKMHICYKSFFKKSIYNSMHENIASDN